MRETDASILFLELESHGTSAGTSYVPSARDLRSFLRDFGNLVQGHWQPPGSLRRGRINYEYEINLTGSGKMLTLLIYGVTRSRPMACVIARAFGIS